MSVTSANACPVVLIENSENSALTPYSPLFDDIYHSRSGALAQAQQVFIAGCQLQQRWRQRDSYSILEAGFGLGINAMATWQAWQQDPQRCRQLHLVSIEKYPLSREQLSATLPQLADYPQLKTQITALLANYPSSLLPGQYRLNFWLQPQQYCFVLDLIIGDITPSLAQLNCQADSLFLDGFSPSKNPQMWQLSTIKQLTKKLRPGASVATWCVAASLKQALTQSGFKLQKQPGLPPKRHYLTAEYQPWHLRRQAITAPAPQLPAATTQAVIVGAGIAGVAMAWALSKRGWQVQLIDQGASAAATAAAPALALAAPHYSADDNPISQLTRAGCLYLRQLLTEIQLPQQYWQQAGVRQILRQAASIPPAWQQHELSHWLQPCQTEQQQPAVFWPQAMHLDMAQLIRHWLAQCPNTTVQWQTKVTKVQRQQDNWLLFDQQRLVAQAPVLILANSLNSLSLCPGLEQLGYPPLQAIRGQMVFGTNREQFELPTRPINGNGHFIPALAAHNAWQWGMGSSFERDDYRSDIRHSSIDENYQKLNFLSPALAQQLRPQFSSYQLQSFCGIRAASKDHLPLIGAVPDLKKIRQIPPNKWQADSLPRQPNLFLLTALGARGLCLAGIGAELIASQLNQQPLPLPQRLCNALDPMRFVLRQTQ